MMTIIIIIIMTNDVHSYNVLARCGGVETRKLTMKKRSMVMIGENQEYLDSNWEKDAYLIQEW